MGDGWVGSGRCKISGGVGTGFDFDRRVREGWWWYVKGEKALGLGGDEVLRYEQPPAGQSLALQSKERVGRT